MYIYIYIYISEEEIKRKKKNNPLDSWCLWLMSYLKLFPVNYWNHSLHFPNITNFAASAFMKIAPAIWKSQLRSEGRRCCILKTHLRPELSRCNFRITGAKLIAAAKRSRTLRSADIRRHEWFLVNSILLSYLYICWWFLRLQFLRLGLK